jgi:membrane associated rhomboid family serine protease
MGFPPRRYGSRFDWRSFITPAIKTLVLTCTGVFLMQTLVRLFGGAQAEGLLVQWFGLVPRLATHGFLWQLFTYMFLHAGIGHLLFNMLFLWMFGRDVERTWGKRRFYTYFFLTGVGAGVITVIVKTLLDPAGTGSAAIPTIGASGAIYAVILAAAVLFPHSQVWLIPFPVTIPMWVYALVAGAIEFFATLGSTGDNVSHVCHLGGMLVGYLYLRRDSYLYRFRNRYSDWRRRRLRSKFETYQRKHRDEPPSRPDQWVN